MIADHLRTAIKSSGESLCAIGRETAIPQPVLTRFMRGDGISLTTAQKLIDYFGFELKRKKGRR